MLRHNNKLHVTILYFLLFCSCNLHWLLLHCFTGALTLPISYGPSRSTSMATEVKIAAIAGLKGFKSSMSDGSYMRWPLGIVSGTEEALSGETSANSHS